jgi:hypothetical protein
MMPPDLVAGSYLERGWNFWADDRVTMWQIDEELRLWSRIGDSPRQLADKHADMGKTVSGYLRRGLRLVENAARGYFPLV